MEKFDNSKSLFEDISIIEYVAGTLSAQTKANFEKALSEDEALQKAVASEQAFRASLEQSKPEPVVSADNIDGLFKLIDEDEQRTAQQANDSTSNVVKVNFTNRFAAGSAIAASLLVAVFFSVNFNNNELLEPNFQALSSSEQPNTVNLNELSNESVASHSTVSSDSALENSIQKPLGAPDELLDTLSGIANDQVSSQINNLENTNLKNTGDVTEDVTNAGIKTPRPKPRPAIAQPEQTSSAPYNGNEYQHFLQTLGLSNSADASHSPDLFAQIFSLVTEQLINILRSRNKLRQQFRLAVTSIQKTDNNPLTFSVNTDDAIHNLFVKKNAGYLPAMDSYEQAFSTIEHHQLAVIDGMRAGFENMLSAFSPESLTGLKPSEKDKKSWGLFSSDKNSFEENYDAHYQQLLKNKEQTFIQLFGEAFTHAYELSVHQQKSEEKRIT